MIEFDTHAVLCLISSIVDTQYVLCNVSRLLFGSLYGYCLEGSG